MSEIEKMYSNSGIKKIELDYPDNFEPFYPEFTAEKQLELIKWLAKRPLTIDNVDDEFEFSTGYKLSDFGSFEESLAEIINNLWQDLTVEEKQQIKEILE